MPRWKLHDDQFILALERLLFVYIAIRLAIAGGFTVGMIVAFQAYKQRLPITGIISAHRRGQR